MIRVGLIGNGGIAQDLLDHMARRPDKFVLTGILDAPDVIDPPHKDHLVPDLPALIAGQPDVIVECATVEALAEDAEAVLTAGIDLIAVSIGGLAMGDVLARARAAAERSGARLHLVAGALAGVDGLAAAHYRGLRQVTYRSRKPPTAWAGAPGTEGHDLSDLREPLVLFQGTARESAVKYPKNANATATAALAGLGLDETAVELVADPGVTRNMHIITAEGDFGRFTIEMAGEPSAHNPRTSALTAASIIRALENRETAIVI